MDQNTQEIAGQYRHYKGNKYEVVAVGLHTETKERLVIYKALSKPHQTWVRPFDMFFETVVIDNKEVPRFEKLRG